MKTDVAVINGGGVRGDKIFPAGSVSRKVLAEILPFDNEIHIVLLTGEQLRKAFEIAASSLVGKDDRYESSVRTYAGGFLQISGARVVYSLSGRPTLVDPDGKVLEWGNRGRAPCERDGAWLPVEDDARTRLPRIRGRRPEATDSRRRRAAAENGLQDLDVLADYIASHPDGGCARTGRTDRCGGVAAGSVLERPGENDNGRSARARPPPFVGFRVRFWSRQSRRR